MTNARRPAFLLLSLLGVLVSAVAGCGGGHADDGFPVVDGGVPLTPADKTFITDFCAAVMPCCAANGVATDAAVCKESMVKLGWSRDPDLRSACLGQLRQLASTGACVPDIADLGGPCARIFDEPSGPSAPGETCVTARDCAGSPGTVTECFGTCITYALGAAGDYPCLGNESTIGFINSIPWKNGSTTPESHAFLCQLRAGLYCDWNDNTCKALQARGGTCTSDTANSCASGTCGDVGCVPLPGVAEACVLDCAGDNYCDADVCAPRLAAGATCVDSTQCSGVCAGSDRCSGTCVRGVCSPLTVAQSLLLGVWCGATPVIGYVGPNSTLLAGGAVSGR